jgi:hypothetical protein
MWKIKYIENKCAKNCRSEEENLIKKDESIINEVTERVEEAKIETDVNFIKKHLPSDPICIPNAKSYKAPDLSSPRISKPRLPTWPAFHSTMSISPLLTSPPRPRKYSYRMQYQRTENIPEEEEK